MLLYKCISYFTRYIFYEDVAECGRVVLISDNMMVTITPAGKHEGPSWVAGSTDRMGNMVYTAHVLHLKWRMGWWCYS